MDWRVVRVFNANVNSSIRRPERRFIMLVTVNVERYFAKLIRAQRYVCRNKVQVTENAPKVNPLKHARCSKGRDVIVVPDDKSDCAIKAGPDFLCYFRCPSKVTAAVDPISLGYTLVPALNHLLVHVF